MGSIDCAPTFQQYIDFTSDYIIVLPTVISLNFGHIQLRSFNFVETNIRLSLLVVIEQFIHRHG